VKHAIPALSMRHRSLSFIYASEVRFL